MASENSKDINLFREDFTQRRKDAKIKTEFPFSSFASSATSRLCVSLFFVLLFLSCKSVPKVVNLADIGAHVPLENGASIYLIADVKEARPLINLLPIRELNDSQTRQMLERTDFLAAALFPKESGRRFQLAAWGDYPSSGAGMAFSINKNWKKMDAAKYSYWYSEANRLSITMSPKQAFAAASVDDMPVEPATAAPGVKMPEGFAEFNKNSEGVSSPLSCWFSDGSSIINRILNTPELPIRFPIRELFIVFFPAAEEGKYEVSIRMQFDSASQARGMASLLTMANNFIYGEIGGKSLLTSIFFANKPVQNDNCIDIKTAVLSGEGIAHLFGIFLFV